MTLFHVASLFCALGGAVILGIVLAGRGVPVVLLGVIVGLLGGWFAGPRAAFDFLRRRARG